MKNFTKKFALALALATIGLTTSGCTGLTSLLGAFRLSDEGLALSANQPNIGYAASVKTEEHNGVLLYGMYASSDGQVTK